MIDDAGSPNIKCDNYGRLKVSGVQLLMLLRALEDSLRLVDGRGLVFCYTSEFRQQLYDDIIAQQDQEVK